VKGKGDGAGAIISLIDGGWMMKVPSVSEGCRVIPEDVCLWARQYSPPSGTQARIGQPTVSSIPKILISPYHS